MVMFEEKAYLEGYQVIAGIDEAGRGPLAGPVVAAACILPRGLLIEGVNDSKKLTGKVRERLFNRLTGDLSIKYGVGIIGPEEIDRINIYQATIQAMWQAVDQLSVSPDYLLIDGVALIHAYYPLFENHQRGPAFLSIAAASIDRKKRPAMTRATR